MKKVYLVVLMGWCIVNGLSQSNPTPFDLSTGNYSFTAWPATSTAGTYPSNMIFHWSTDPTSGSFNPLSIGTADYSCPYNLTIRNRILGKGVDGFSFIATGDGQNNTCAGGTTANRFVGSAILALNTTDRNSINVTWVGGTVSTGERTFIIQLQYRIGTTGNFTNLSSSYTSSGTAGNSQTVGPLMLPEACENKAVVQLRWIYYQTSSSLGTRPELRVDDISVTSLSTIPAIEPTVNSISFGNVVQNTSSVFSFSFNAYNLNPESGSINISAPSGFQVSKNASSGYLDNLSIPYTDANLLDTLYVRFTPTLVQSYSNNLTLSGGSATRNINLTGAGVLPQTVSNFQAVRTAPDRINLSWTKPAGTYGTDWDGVVVFARENSSNAVDLTNTDGTAFSGGGNVYGSGTLRDGSFCVSRTTTDNDGNLTVTGLTENQTYYFVAYAYKVIPGGSNDTWSLSSVEISAAAVVTNISGFSAIPLSGQASLSWTNPFTSAGVWFDEVVIVGKLNSSVTYVPTGNGSSLTADFNFGSGTEVASNEFVVYKGSGSAFVVSNLTNGSLYFIKAFVRNGNSWSSGVQVNVTPTVGNVYYSCSSGNHTAAIWSLNNPSCPTSSAITFNPTTNIVIQNGHTVVLNGSPINVQNITVNSGGKLWTNANFSNPRYMNLFGNLTCNGEIGGPTDGFSLNIEDGNHLISGNGIIRIARIRKSDENNASGTANVTVDANMQLTFNGTALYNNRFSSNFFNLTINEGKTIELTNSQGSVAIDGVHGNSGNESAGTITVNGTLIVPNTYYAYTNNSGIYTCKLVIGSTGLARIGFLTYNASGSGSATHVLEVKSGGKLEISSAGSGDNALTNYSSQNNIHLLETNSTVEFSRSGNQQFQADWNFHHLILSGSGDKSYTSGNLTVNGNLDIQNTAVLQPPSTSTLTINGNWSGHSSSAFNPQSTSVVLSGYSQQSITCPALAPNKYIHFHNLQANQLLLASNLRLSGHLSILQELDGQTFNMEAITSTAPSAELSANSTIRTKNKYGFDGLFSLASPTYATNHRVYFNGSENQLAGTKLPAQLSGLIIENSGPVSNNIIQVSNSIIIDDSLVIKSGVLSYSGAISGNANVVLKGGILDIKKTNSIEPNLSGNFLIESGKISFTGAGTQTIKSGIPYYDLEIAGSGTKYLDDEDTLTINNNLIVSNTSIQAGNSIVSYQKNGDQEVAGGFAYNHLVIKNGGSKKLTQNASIQPSGILQLNQTQFDLDGKELILDADANQSASLGKVDAGSSIINAQNFGTHTFLSSKVGSRHLTISTIGTNLSQWKDSVQIIGPQAGGFDPPYISSQSSIRFFNEAFGGTNKNSGWTNILNANHELEVGRGYSLIYNKKKPGIVTGSVKLKSTGSPKTGATTLPVTFSNTVTEGYNLVGNPYPCAIDWDSEHWTKTNMENAFYLWDINLSTSGAYFSYVNGIPSHPKTNPSIIPAGHAIFVKATANHPELSLNENVKYLNPTGIPRKEPFPTFLRLKASDESGAFDHLVWYVTHQKVENTFSPMTDARKFFQSGLNFWLKEPENQDCSIYGSSVSHQEVLNIPLSISSTKSGKIKIEVETYYSSQDTVEYFVYDLLLDQYHPIHKDLTLEITLTPTENNSVNNRYFITSKAQKSLLNDLLSEINQRVSIFPNPVKEELNIVYHVKGVGSKIKLTDVFGKCVKELLLTQGESKIDVSELREGVYFLQIEKEGQKTVRKIIKY